MHRAALQMLWLASLWLAAAAATTRVVAVKAAEVSAPGSDKAEDALQTSGGDDLKTDASGRLFDLGLTNAYNGYGYGARYQPDSGNYGSYGSYQPSYGGQGVSGYGSYGSYGGYGGYNTLSRFQPCYSGFGSASSGFEGFQPSYSPIGPSYYPTTSGSYPGSLSNSYPASSTYPGSLSGLGPDYRGYKGSRGYSSSYSPYNTRYGA